MNLLRCFFLVVSVIIPVLSFAQIGGRTGYSFLEVPVAARQAALGGTNVSVLDKDVSMGYQNPALLNDSIDKHVSFTYQPYFADIKKSTLFAASSFKKIKGTFSTGLNYFDYGTINQTDASGNVTGVVLHPVEYALVAGYARSQGPFSMGVNGKFVHSSIAGYTASAVMVDFGVLYKHSKEALTVGLVFRNVGFNLSNYVKGQPVNLPFDIQLGSTYKPKHMPLRLSVTATHLYTMNVVYNDPALNVKVNLDGSVTPIPTTFSDKVLRHFVIGGELIVSKNIHFLFGYNFLMRRELKLQSMAGPAGITWGFMFRVKKFEIGFTRAYYSVQGGTSYFTLGLNMHEWIKK
jgi:hypothetical protein